MGRKDLSPMPQVLHRADASNGVWSIEVGSCHRGDAWTNHTTRAMRVPLSDTPMARVVRAHEMAHARVSPVTATSTTVALQEEFGNRVVECVEEIRVNTLIARLGFDLELLHDGSEKPGGLQLATAGGRESWNEAVAFTAALVGSPAALKDFHAGIRKGSVDWARGLARMARELHKVVEQIGTREMADTTPTEDGTPRGFEITTTALGRIVAAYCESALGHGAELTPDLARALTRAGQAGARRAPTGRWADLVVLDLPLTERVQSSSVLGRTSHPYAQGTRVAYPGNALRDPMRRVFRGPLSAPGGVVVIDQSGSMDMDGEKLSELLAASPSLTVIGYSHRPGSQGVPNAWMLARGGYRVAAGNEPAGNVGNGVDLPVLEWANKMRRGAEPLVWVCDGQTTDSADYPFGAAEVARFIAHNRVHCLGSVDELSSAVRRGRAVLAQMKMAAGRVGIAAASRTSATLREMAPSTFVAPSVAQFFDSDVPLTVHSFGIER
jgi:hypothetical protein